MLRSIARIKDNCLRYPMTFSFLS